MIQITLVDTTPSDKTIGQAIEDLCAGTTVAWERDTVAHTMSGHTFDFDLYAETSDELYDVLLRFTSGDHDGAATLLTLAQEV